MSIFNGEVSIFTTLNVMPRELFAMKTGSSVYIFLVILLVSDSVSANCQENYKAVQFLNVCTIEDKNLPQVNKYASEDITLLDTNKIKTIFLKISSLNILEI